MVTSNGNLIAASGRGVDASSETGDVTVMTTGDVIASSTGIFAQSNTGGGAVKVTSDGRGVGYLCHFRNRRRHGDEYRQRDGNQLPRHPGG